MFKIIYPLKDTTIYDRYPEKNVGIDQIIEITKYTQGDSYQSSITENYPWPETYNSRILMKFDLTPIQTVLTEFNPTSIQSKLILIPTEAESLQNEYTLYAYPIAEDWRNGNGNYNDSPAVNNGVSWYYKTNGATLDEWSTSHQYQQTHISGGGSWYTSSVASQSFSFEEPTVNMDITNILHRWLSSSITNNGIIIKHSEDAETNTDIYGSLKFFAKETHTIYIPRLVTYISETTYTGSFTTASLIGPETEYIIHARNLKTRYKLSDDVKVRYRIKDVFAEQTYQSSSILDYASLRLPTSSYYSIVDSITNIPMVDFNTVGTRINTDDYGHYIRINFNNFLPERYYKIVYKIINDEGTRIIDPKHEFKVIR